MQRKASAVFESEKEWEQHELTDDTIGNQFDKNDVRFNIVIPFYKNYDTIEKLLLSIADQDYKNYSVTVIVDGPDEKAQDLLVGLLKEFNFNLEILHENVGAAKARNYGAKISGEDLVGHNSADDVILFFIDADCKLMPGILTDFKTEFELDKELKFCYGNYRFELDKPAFISQDYDPYLLQTMNYIPTMSPVKRGAFNEVGGFDEDRKYFQDWGLFYKLSKKSFMGKYLGKNYFVFSTVSPTENSISGSKGMTIAEKCKEFREYYGIEDKQMVVSTWGAPLQAIQRAKMLDADYVGAAKGSDRMAFPVNYFFENWKYTYMVGCYNQTISALENHMTSIVGRPVYHFIGTDVFQMFNTHSIAALTDIKKMFKAQKAVLLTNSSTCQKEMKRCGFDTELVHTPIFKIDRYGPQSELPKQFTVGVYISGTNNAHKVDGAGGLSNIPLIMDVARAMPDIKFKLFGIDGMYEEVGNVEYCGLIPEKNMVDFINECSMVLRSTIHDGFPQLPIQFMLCGRQALVSCPDPELKYARKLDFLDNLDWETNKDELITKIYLMSETYDEEISMKSHEYYSELLDVKKFKDKIYSLVEGK